MEFSCWALTLRHRAWIREDREFTMWTRQTNRRARGVSEPALHPCWLRRLEDGLGQIRMPNKDGAAYFPISEDELAVPSRVPVFEAQLVCPFARCFGLPDQKQIYLRHLQLRRGYGARVAQVAAKQVGGGNVGLLHARRPEPVYASLILGDVAGGKM